MNSTFGQIIRFILFILVQVFVLFEIKPLHQFIVPYLYFLYLLWLPFNMPRLGLTFLGFLFGLSLDYFTKTPGLHAAACTLIAYLRPFVINVLIRQDVEDMNYKVPSINSMGFAPYMTYALILTFIHHSYLIFLEFLQFGSFWYLAGKILGTTGISMLLIMVTELIFYRKEKFRTNTT